MKEPFRIVLASASPRRVELLALAGVPFVADPPRVDEVPLPGESPRRFARRAAREKGEEVARRRPGDWVLSADTIVAVGGTILGKPADRGDAAAMLSLLQGREHRVLTAVSLLCASRGYRDEAVESTRVRFRPLSAGEIRGYLDAMEWEDKAGAYAVQGKGSLLVEKVNGSFANVVGLPVTRVIDLLVRAGVARLDPRAAAGGGGWYRFAPPGRG